MSIDDQAARTGVIHEPPFALLPDPVSLFERRETRLRFLAKASRLGPYLCFLADVVACQAASARQLPAVALLPAAGLARAREARMPPVDRAGLVRSEELVGVLDDILARLAAIEMPEAAQTTREVLAGSDEATKVWVLEQVLAGDIAGENAGPALFGAAAVQVHAGRLAATLDARRLVPVGTGACPCCGGRPASSIVLGDKRAEGARYAACATCGTLWNEVRVKCLACGSTKGIGYRSLGEDAVVKAEVCDACHSWVKILYATRDPALEALADDVASLGLDAQLAGSAWRRAGFDPFLVGF